MGAAIMLYYGITLKKIIIIIIIIERRNIDGEHILNSFKFQETAYFRVSNDIKL